MQKATFTLILCLFVLTGSAQTFSDDFESYTNGSYLAQSSPDWTTWSNNPGSAEDVLITDADANSGTQSIYFSSTSASGGPQDVVLPFGPTSLVTGQFTFEQWMKVEANKGAYLNFQADPVIGTEWAMQAHFIQNGDLIIDSDGAIMLTTTYPNNTWFKLTIDIDLNTNQWDILIDGTSKGTFSNNINRVASLNLFPVNGTGVGGNDQSGFYVDDVSYTHVPYTLTARNGAVIGIDHGLKVAGQTVAPNITVRNLGTQAITSFDLTIDYNGNQLVENVTGVNIASLGTYEVAFSQALSAASGSNNLTATISNVNGQGADLDPADDSKTVAIDPIIPAPGRIIVAEEATGTWCQWCPRGTVAMWEMSTQYPDYFAGIAVHNNDPMADPVYDSGLGNYIGGYPSALVNRRPEIDPADIEEEFLQLIGQPIMAQVENSATYNPGSSQLSVDMRIEFEQATSGEWRVAMVLTEDSVTGTSSGYAQINAYSYQASNLPLVGAGKDWQQEPSTVPASEMVYDHVARLIEPSFQGEAGIIPASVSAGDTIHATFSATLDPDWDMEKMHIVTLLIGPNGEIDNAGYSKVSDAEQVTGLPGDLPVCGYWMDDIEIYPNPATDIVQLRFELDDAASATVDLMTVQGRILQTQSASGGNSDITFKVDNLASGLYLIQINMGDITIVRKVVVQ